MTTQLLENILTNASALDSTRKRIALNYLEENGLPNRRNEAWKYTTPEKFIANNPSAPKVKIHPALLDISPYQIYFKNGAADLSRTQLPSNVSITNSIPSDAKTLPGFAGALNAVNAGLGVTLTISARTIPDAPILIMHEDDKAPMLFIQVEKLAKVSILEAFSADLENDSLCAPATWINLAEGAQAEHVKTVIGGRGQVHIATTQATLARDALFDSFVFAAGSKLMRQELQVEIKGQGAHANAHGLFALRGTQHADQHVSLLHNAAHTTSQQLFKMVLDDESRGIFTGRLEVAKDAQKVDASQLNKNLVLSKKAHVDTRPQLMVHADDVKCAHGATVGQLSAEEIFYLQSRGLTQSRAQKVLCHAFASDAVMHIKSDSLRLWVSDLLFENFEQFALEKFEE